MNLPKTRLRRQLLQHRQALSPELWQQQSRQICTQLESWTQFQQAQTILAYHHHRQEPDLSYLFNLADKQWGLPRCVGEELFWHRWQPQQPLV